MFYHDPDQNAAYLRTLDADGIDRLDAELTAMRRGPLPGWTTQSAVDTAYAQLGAEIRRRLDEMHGEG